MILLRRTVPLSKGIRFLHLASFVFLKCQVNGEEMHTDTREQTPRYTAPELGPDSAGERYKTVWKHHCPHVEDGLAGRRCHGPCRRKARTDKETGLDHRLHWLAGQYDDKARDTSSPSIRFLHASNGTSCEAYLSNGAKASSTLFPSQHICQSQDAKEAQQEDAGGPLARREYASALRACQKVRTSYDGP